MTLKRSFSDTGNAQADTAGRMARGNEPAQTPALTQHILQLQQSSGNHATHKALSRVSRFPLIQRQSISPSPINTNSTAPSLQSSAPVGEVQNQQTETATNTATNYAKIGTETAQPAVQGLIVENTEPNIEAGQMRKDQFLAELRQQICAASEEEMAQSDFSSQGCPWIDMYLRFYEGRSAGRIERDLLRYAPEAQGARTAQDYIPFIAARVQRSVAVWMETGDITGVPEGIPTGLSGFGLVGRLLFKAGPGGPTGNPHPLAVRSQLGSGQALAPSVQSRMGSVFGRSFSNVRTHTGGIATQLTNRFNARAFSIGNHVVFGAGEYRPNSLMGDALLAHELAHVAQQSLSPPGKIETARSHTSILEHDADFSAVRAVTSLYSGLKEHVGGLRGTALPRLRSGLQLQCCKSAEQKEIERLAKVQRTFMIKEIEDKKRQEAEKMRQAEIERRKKAGEKDPKVPPVMDKDIKASEADIAKYQKKKATPPPLRSTNKWDVEVKKDGGKSYKKRAKKAIEKVIKKADSKPEFDDIAKMLKKAPPTFNEDTAKQGLKEGWFGWASGSKFKVSMDWIEVAEKEPRNVFANIAHEVGGHIVYGTGVSKKIADEVLKSLDAKTRATMFPPKSNKKAYARAHQAYYEAYGLPETEIYGELRERKWVESFDSFTPVPQTDLPDKDIPRKLATIKKNWAPEVAQVILQRLVDRARKDPGIRAKDVTFLIGEIAKAKFPFTIK